MRPARAIARQFLRRSPMEMLVFGICLTLFDFATLYLASDREGVLHIKNGVGLLDNYGLLSTLFGNTVALYLARKYYEVVASISASKAVVRSSASIERALSTLEEMVKMRGTHGFLFYGFVTVGVVAWLSNVSGHVFDNPELRWGHKVFDSLDHPVTFAASRIHNIYTWVFILPLLAHVFIYATLQLRRAVAAAFLEGALVFDVLNPDKRGGFGFIDNANIIFNGVAALIYVQVTMHIGTFEKLNPEHITAYIVVTVVLVITNRVFLGDLYAAVKSLKLESLNRIKDQVYRENKLSFEILKYCYEMRVNTLSFVSAAIKAAAIAIPGIVKVWPAIAKALAA